MNLSDVEIIRSSEEEVKSLLGGEFLLTDDSNFLLSGTPTPATFSLMQRIYSTEGALGKGYKRIGINPKPFQTDRYLVKIVGRAFINLREDEKIYLKPLGLSYKIENRIPSIVESAGSFGSKFNRFFYSLNSAWLLANFELFLDELQLIARALETLPEQPESLEEEVANFTEEYSYIVSAGVLFQLLAMKEKLEGKPLKEDRYAMNLTGNRADSDFELFAPRWHEIGYAPEPELERDSFKLAETDLEKIALVKNNLRFHILNRVARIRKSISRIGEFAFFLTIDELVAGEIDYEKAAARRQEYELNMSIPYRGSGSQSLEETEDLENRSESLEPKQLKGNPVSNGIVSGVLMVVDSPTLMRKLDISKGAKEKPIIVLPSSGPEFTPIYKQAAGLIFGKGGMLSHGAIIAREYGIPAIVFTDIEELKRYEHKRFEINATTGQISPQ